MERDVQGAPGRDEGRSEAGTAARSSAGTKGMTWGGVSILPSSPQGARTALRFPPGVKEGGGQSAHTFAPVARGRQAEERPARWSPQAAAERSSSPATRETSAL